MKLHKIRKAALILTIVILSILVIVNLFAYLMFDGQAVNRVHLANHAARDVFGDLESAAEQLDLPEQGTAFLSGRCADRHSIAWLCTDTESGEQILLNGSKAGKETDYWTAEIKDGKIQQVWYAYHPLTESELHSYTWEMQRESVRFGIFPLHIRDAWVNDRDLIGYRTKGEANGS